MPRGDSLPPKKKHQAPARGLRFRFPTHAADPAKTCPHCQQPYSPTDGLTVTRVPWGRKIEGWVFPVTVVWSIVLVIGTLTFAALHVPKPDAPLERGLGWFLVYGPLIPGGLLSILSWCFPHVRIHHCRHCGVSTETRLKPDRKSRNSANEVPSALEKPPDTPESDTSFR